MSTAFLDIETTGLDPFQHEILEVAIVTDSHETCFSLPINEQRADAKALEVNRYHERREELASIQAYASTAADILKRELTDAIVVGNNVQFDLRFIEQFMRRWWFGRSATPWHYHPVDLKALVAGYYALGPAPWSTGDIAEAAGVPIPADAHSALADARWNMDVYRKVVGS